MSRFGQRGRLNKWRRPSIPEPPMGPITESLDLDRIDAISSSTLTPEVKIEDVTFIASYNWLNRDERVILVPGQPPRWAPAKGDIRIQEDAGRYYRDKNAARSPDHPFAPAITACLATSPALLDDVDVVACGSTLGNLLRFVRNQDKKCRMLVEKVGSAVFLIRRENSPTETIPDVHGFGHGFPEACTEWAREVKNSASHQRIIKYRFGGLNLLVRYEADGYIGVGGTSKPAGATARLNSDDRPSPKSPVEVDSLTQALSTANVSSYTEQPPPSPTTEGEALRLKCAGRIVSQSQLFDLKTRSTRKAGVDHLQEELPRLWVSQIPNFVLAFHTHGLFREADIHVTNVTEEVQSWEAQHQRELIGLVSLLRQIVKLSSSTATENGRLEVTMDGLGKLYFRKQLDDAREALPRDLKVAWELRCTHGAAEPESDEADDNKDGGVDVLKWEDPVQDLTGCSEACNYCGQCV